MNIYWTRSARDDLQSVWNIAARSSTLYANKFVNELITSAHNIGNSPKTGKVVPEINDPDTREIVSHSYRIMYQIRKDRLYIMQVTNDK
jgi:plasmid stabilization system protein ParE